MAKKSRQASAFCGVMLWACLAGRAQAASRPSVTVLLYNQAGISAEVLVRAKAEVARIYDEAGIDLSWGDPTSAATADKFTIRLMIRPRGVGVASSVMGAALGDMHETGGSAFVFFDRVVRSAHEREQDVAPILSFAMAHEMGHLLLPFPAHAASGVMRAAWDGDDLRHIANGSLQFAPVQQAAIRVKASNCCTSTIGR